MGGVSRELGTALGVIIILSAFNVVLLACNGWQAIVKGTPFWGFHEHLNARCLVDGPIKPWGLFLLRALQFVLFLFVILWQAFGPSNLVSSFNPSWIKYFTNWTFLGFGLQALIGTSLAGCECWRVWHRRKTQSEPTTHVQQAPPAGEDVEQQPEQQNIRPYSLLDKVYLLLFEVFFCSALVATVFYWAAEYQSEKTLKADDVLRHGAHLFLMVLDLSFSWIPVLWSHFVVVVLYHTAYAIFLFVYQIERWVYNRLDWEQQLAPVYYAIIACLVLFSFALMYAIPYTRDKLHQRVQQNEGGERCTA